jgi:hypothetical protein
MKRLDPKWDKTKRNTKERKYKRQKPQGTKQICHSNVQKCYTNILKNVTMSRTNVVFTSSNSQLQIGTSTFEVKVLIGTN